MKHTTCIFIALGVLLSVYVCEGSNKAQSLSYWPTESWRTSTPEQQGMDSEQLAKLFEFAQENEVNIHSLIIIRNGYVVLEANFYPNSKGILHNLASVTKSITSTLIGIAIDKGFIKSVKQRILDFFPGRSIQNLDERKKHLTIEHLLTMRTGFCRDFYHGERQLDQMRRSDDWVQFMLDQPLLTKPGTEFAYCTGASHLLSAIITQATGNNELDFARQYLFTPLGIQDVIWPTDPQGNNTGGFDFYMHSQDMAKIGYLFLHDGKWGDKQVLSSEWVMQATRQHVTLSDGEGYGYRWWMPDELPGLYEARGRGGQRICVWPEKDLVVVFTGNGFEPGDIGDFIVASVQSDQSLTENPEAYKLLQKKRKEATKAPAPNPVPELPPIANKISGKTYIFEPNDFELISFSLIFEKKNEAVFRLIEENHEEENTVGLDGVYRISNNSSFGLPEALKGYWETDRDFSLLYNEFANSLFFRIRISFKEDKAIMEIDENTGVVNTTIEAKVQQ